MSHISPKKSHGINSARTLKLLLEKHGFPIKSVLLFGSFAKGTMNENSDIDVAVVHDPFKKSRSEELRDMCLAEKDSDLSNIEVIYFHPEDMSDKYSTIVQEVKKWGIEV